MAYVAAHGLEVRARASTNGNTVKSRPEAMIGSSMRYAQYIHVTGWSPHTPLCTVQHGEMHDEIIKGPGRGGEGGYRNKFGKLHDRFSYDST